jgi:hypothetical protein
LPTPIIFPIVSAESFPPQRGTSATSVMNTPISVLSSAPNPLDRPLCALYAQPFGLVPLTAHSGHATAVGVLSLSTRARRVMQDTVLSLAIVLKQVRYTEIFLVVVLTCVDRPMANVLSLSIEKRWRTRSAPSPIQVWKIDVK